MDRRPYPTDLTPAQQKRIEPWMTEDASTGRPPKHAKSEIVNAILYATRNGCTWRSLPHDLPPHDTVSHGFRKWQGDGTRERIHDKLRERVRRQAGNKPKPIAAVLDSQAIKTTEQGGPRGLDAGEKSARPQAALGR